MLSPWYEEAETARCLASTSPPPWLQGGAVRAVAERGLTGPVNNELGSRPRPKGRSAPVDQRSKFCFSLHLKTFRVFSRDRRTENGAGVSEKLRKSRKNVEKAMLAD